MNSEAVKESPDSFFDRYRWVPHVLSIELKKAFSYRVTFWVRFLLGTGCDLGVAYFLWKALFVSQQVEKIEGYSFHGLVYYSLFAVFSGKITRGSDRGYLSQDIYDGSFTRYLLYPLPFLGYKYATHITQQALAIFQLLVSFAVLWLAIGFPAEQNIGVGSFFSGCLTCVLAGYLVFTLMSCLEMVAFWQDVVWNLIVMLRFAMGLLGGAMVPLVFFPAWGQYIVHHTPFPAMISFPARTFLGQVGLEEWLIGCLVLLCWSLVFSILARFIWLKGMKQYSGVGI